MRAVGDSEAKPLCCILPKARHTDFIYTTTPKIQFVGLVEWMCCEALEIQSLPMKNSLEHAAESYLIELFLRDDRLTGRKILHFDEDQKAFKDCIVIEATQGEQELAGPQAAQIEVTATYRSASGTKRGDDIIADGMREAITGAAGGKTDAEQAFANPGVLILFPEQISSDRSNTKTSRKRSITIPMLAKLRP